MSRHRSLKGPRVRDGADATRVQQAGQAYASARKQGRLPEGAECPRSHHRTGRGMAEEMERLAEPYSGRR